MAEIVNGFLPPSLMITELPSWPVLVLLLVLAFILLTWPNRIQSSVPGPCRHIPYFGALFTVLKEYQVLPEFVYERCLEYGFCTWGAQMPKIGLLSGALFFVNTPECLEHMLGKNFENYVKGESVRAGLNEFLGDGIFSADGPSWVTHRKVASHMFSRNLMRESTKVALDHGERMIGWLKDRIQAGMDGPLDMQDMYFRLTMDIFTYIAFGVDLKAVIQDEPPAFATAFDTVQEHSEKRFFNPLWRFCQVFQLTPGERKLRQGVTTMNKFASEVIQGRRRQMSEHEPLGPDLLSRFLANADTKNETLSDNELRDIVMNFMIAGRDTTACGLSWTLYELRDKPEIQAKIREEFQQVCGNGRVTYDSVGNLRYTHAVAMEVLRLHPSVPKDLKFAVKSDVLPDGTKIPAGSAIIYTPYAMGRNPKIWDDPLTFRPERFLGRPEPSPFAYPVFNAGKRLCLGKSLALMEMKLITALVLTHFDYTAEAHAGGYKSTLVLPMNPGLRIRFTQRQGTAATGST